MSLPYEAVQGATVADIAFITEHFRVLIAFVTLSYLPFLVKRYFSGLIFRIRHCLKVNLFKTRVRGHLSWFLESAS